MCNLLGCLNGKLECFRRRGFPVFDRGRAGDPVKRVIDLDTVQSARVVPQKLLFGNIRRIEDRLPFFVAEAGRTEPNPRHSGIIAQSIPERRVFIDLYKIRHQKRAKIGRF